MNKNITTFVLLGIAFVFALVLGTNVASADYESLTVYAVSGIALYFLVHGWKNVWWFTALLGFSGVVFSHGFNFDAGHVFVAMLVIAFVISAVNREYGPRSIVMKSAGGSFLIVLLVILIIYGFLHFVIGLVFPYSPSEYSWKSSSKAYFEAFATMFVSCWLLIGPYQFRLNAPWHRTFVIVLVSAVVGNTAARGLMYLQGFQAGDGLSRGGFAGIQEYFLFVPVINMQAGVYTLRDLSPVATVILAMIATSGDWKRSQSLLLRSLVIIGIVSALVGAAFSGGRATLPFCLGLLGLVALVRKRLGLVLLMGFGGILLIMFANLFSTYINVKAPISVARSMQLILIDKGKTYEGISGSQDVRNAAMEQALEEWQENGRTLVFGRSVLNMTAEEAYYIGQTLGAEGFVVNAMKSGRTHNLITDLLLQYGLVGLILYISCYLAMIFYFIRLYRRIPDSVYGVKALVGAVAIYLPVVFIYQAIGGQFMPIVVPLIIGIARAGLVKYELEIQEALNVSSSVGGRDNSLTK